MEAACVGSLMEPSSSASGTAPRLAWKWILEKLVALPDFGVAFINGSCFRDQVDEFGSSRVVLE